MTTHELATQVKAAHNMTVDVRHLRAHDASLSSDALYLVTESRMLRERGGYTMVGAVRQVYRETLGCPIDYLHEALRHVGG